MQRPIFTSDVEINAKVMALELASSKCLSVRYKQKTARHILLIVSDSGCVSWKPSRKFTTAPQVMVVGQVQVREK